MFRSLPTLAVLLGVAGIIPFVLTGVGSVGANPEHALAATRGLVGYGAIVLGFLGGVHWGFTLSDKGDDEAVRSRLLLGVAPALVGWAAVILSIVTEPVFSLILLTAGFIGAVVVETRAHRRGLMPDGYLMLRWVISVVVILILTIVTVLRFFGARVLL
jgi:hypothetical protein